MSRTLKCLLPSILCIVLLTVVVSVAAVFVLPKVVEAINKGVETAAGIPARVANQGVDTAVEAIDKVVKTAGGIPARVVNYGFDTAGQVAQTFMKNGQAMLSSFGLGF